MWFRFRSCSLSFSFYISLSISCVYGCVALDFDAHRGFRQIRDGQYGFSTLIGKYCGTDFPPEITSKERYLWLHFHSDDTIEYTGFSAVYEYLDRNREAPSTDLNCTIEKDGYEGFINSTDVPAEIREQVIRDKIALDCIWRIQVKDNWKVRVCLSVCAYVCVCLTNCLLYLSIDIFEISRLSSKQTERL